MQKKVIIISVIIVIILAIIAIPIIWYSSNLKPVNKSDTGTYKVEIPMGSGVATIANKLEEAGVIKSKIAFRIYVSLNKVSNFQAGTYNLTKAMSLEEIAAVLQTGKVASDDVINITFVEGKNMRWVAQKIAESTNNTEDDVYDLLKDEEYINSLISDYWFITDEIKNKDIYYPLEGYFFPDTYQFKDKNVTVNEIFKTLLDQMENKLEPYKESLQLSSGYTVHNLLSIASIIENEAVYDKDRKDVSSVLYNRLKANMALQSDVTTYYAFKVDMGERDLYLSEINTYNPYNTRGPNMAGKLPVGPISMVSLSSIEAAINPNETPYIFFVADKNGNVYFTRTNEEHDQKVNELKEKGLWIEF